MKANKTKMKPKNMPHKPDYWELAEKRKRRGYHMAHPSWEFFLG
jgi:hypothetical protein